jgi:hypothetical protein
MKIRFVGHASFSVESNGTTLLCVRGCLAKHSTNLCTRKEAHVKVLKLLFWYAIQD